MNKPSLPENFKYLQGTLLRVTFKPQKWYPNLTFAGSDIDLYYDVNRPNWSERLDWLGIVGVVPHNWGNWRFSYVVWKEGIKPIAIVEFLFPGEEYQKLAREIRQPWEPQTKWVLYESVLRVPYYVVFDPSTDEMKAFCLEGDRYQPAELTDGRLSIPSLELSLALWQGSYRSIDRLWLRWMTLDGDFILTPEEEDQQL